MSSLQSLSTFQDTSKGVSRRILPIHAECQCLLSCVFAFKMITPMICCRLVAELVSVRASHKLPPPAGRMKTPRISSYGPFITGAQLSTPLIVLQHAFTAQRTAVWPLLTYVGKLAFLYQRGRSKISGLGSHKRSRKSTCEPGDTLANVTLAYKISNLCASDLFSLLWKTHPLRTVLMVVVDIVRGIFPAFRGYSQALIINELQSMLSSGEYTTPRLVRHILIEVFRMGVESILDAFATSNETIVHGSARYLIEYKQMEQRVRLDVPTLADPVVRDLLHESDLFVRSFNGMSAFGFLSPFDFMRILTLISELISHIWLLSSLTFGGTSVSVLAFSLISSFIPLGYRWLGGGPKYFEDFSNIQEVRTAAKQERMRNLAHSDPYRPEIILFGLGPWILHSWARARKAMLGLEQKQPIDDWDFVSKILSGFNVSGLFSTLQHIPLVLILQSSSNSLGAFTLYRSSVQCLFLTAGNLLHTIRMVFQSIFMMGAFFAAMELEPRLQPKPDIVVKYRSSPGGMKIEMRNLDYTYPGSPVPSLRDVNLIIEAGETLAIVGHNGSGKSTLANVLLRIFDFDSGEFLVNGTDIRKIRPSDYHAHITAVFQGFSKFNTSVKGNVGIGYIQDMHTPGAIEAAMHLAGAADLVHALPRGVKTKLDVTGCDRAGYSPTSAGCSNYVPPHGLSGGEWQRIAISRAFMRADRPEVGLVLLDEPTSSLDAHAQNRVFETIEKISRTPDGNRTKTIIFVTHRLSTARKADKIAMMENGTIAEFGTHHELLKRNGLYAALYRASI
ncbi:Lipid A export ATP-binding/permease protein MsbA [Grifola frondosa]|uniref:Lipid A export ATP-binding/permease protein MsbA n=1 Tax=Grifola frondosa TaxID=5627 RepID=A0A1C7MJ72_GRIFR|nr:Lipid A export ATP-binding/permease protein MsbA [Grifola frondosa]